MGALCAARTFELGCMRALVGKIVRFFEPKCAGAKFRRGRKVRGTLFGRLFNSLALFCTICLSLYLRQNAKVFAFEFQETILRYRSSHDFDNALLWNGREKVLIKIFRQKGYVETHFARVFSKKILCFHFPGLLNEFELKKKKNKNQRLDTNVCLQNNYKNIMILLFILRSRN